MYGVGAVLGIMQIAASVSGVPGLGAAVTILKEISDRCEQISGQKAKARQLAKKCERLLLCLYEQTHRLEGTDLMAKVDEVTSVLETINSRLRKWSQYNAVTAFFQSAKIDDGLASCFSDIETAMSTFTLGAQTSIRRAQVDEAEVGSHRHHEQMEQMRKNAQRMDSLQLELCQLRESLQVRESPSENILASSPVIKLQDNPRYLELQNQLVELHRRTGAFPSVKKLDGQVELVGDEPVAGGMYSDVWLGRWLGEEKVALKALRSIKASDSRATRRFEREIKVWSDLENDHILLFYGIVTDIGRRIHIVAAWQENGNVREYVTKHPEANKSSLLLDAAKGLAYLHAREIVHGNVKCSNVLVSSSGQACICDFGMSKLLEDVTNVAASTTLVGNDVDWLAPELIMGAISSPTKQSDTYSFAMTILELFIMKRPWAHIKQHHAMIQAIANEKKPPRPQKAASCITDGLWEVMEACWAFDPSLRPGMGEVVRRMELI